MLFSHQPYLIDKTPKDEWQEAEKRLSTKIRMAFGSEILDQRQELFFPARFFFNLNSHLNEYGRQHRTSQFIADLRRIGLP